jgi:acetyl esterase/lipase
MVVNPMCADVIDLWPGDAPGLNPGWRQSGWAPNLTVLLRASRDPLPMVLVFAGGAYHGRAEHEGMPVAEFFWRAGYHAAVVAYRTQFHADPAALGQGPLWDAQRAVQLVRAHATAWRVLVDRVVTVGFSAGGHLAAMLATNGEARYGGVSDEASRMRSRPDAAVLCYPAILPIEPLEQNLVGPGCTPVLYRPFRPDLAVDRHTPPMFLWHALDDTGVPPEHSFAMARAMIAAGAHAEVHVFASGSHGLGLAASDPAASQWPGLCLRWLHGRGFVADASAEHRR